jgi:hypothetical protein
LFTSFVTIAVNCRVPFTLTLAVVGETEIATPLMVAVAVAEMAASATEVATMVTLALAGTPAGAVYVAALPLAVVAGAIVPQLGEQFAPPCVSVQLTPLLLASLLTVAVKACVPCTGTVTLGGVTATVSAGTVIVAVAVLLPSVTEAAVIVTVRLLAGATGAV